MVGLFGERQNMALDTQRRKEGGNRQQSNQDLHRACSIHSSADRRMKAVTRPLGPGTKF